jgi:predicted 2-oxoglutarate/Fe(II)-dependent dioxygenase YbiX
MYVPPFPIEPTEVVGGCIAIWRDVWPNPNETIDTIEKVTSDINSGITFNRAVLGNNQIDVHQKRTNSHLFLTETAQKNDDLRKINNQYFDLVFSTMRYYTNRFCDDLPHFFVEGFNVLKYQTGQEYKAHFDGDTSTHRSLSPILYLNDDYTGGEIEFVHHNVTIKPSPGMLVLFPANYAYSHIAHPVKTGTKYAIVTWLHDQPQGNK